MTRKEKARRVMESRGQVFHVRDFGVVEVRTLSRDYEFEVCDGTLTPMGRSTCQARSKSHVAAEFRRPWDGGNRHGREQFDLDIDMQNAPADEIEKFRRSVLMPGRPLARHRPRPM